MMRGIVVVNNIVHCPMLFDGTPKRAEGWVAYFALVDWRTGKTILVYKSPPQPNERQARQYVPDHIKRRLDAWRDANGQGRSA